MYMYGFVFKQIKRFVNAEYILYSETMYIYSVYHAVLNLPIRVMKTHTIYQ